MVTIDPAPRRLYYDRFTGEKKPATAVLVTRASRWGNPYRVGALGVPDRVAAVAKFRLLLAVMRADLDPADYLAPAPRYPSHAEIRQHLAGRDLICCKLDGLPCHADVLLAAANPELYPDFDWSVP